MMRQLLPTPGDPVDLAAAYAYPGPAEQRPWLRANMVTSLDGSAVQEGRSGGLSTQADKEVFGLLRGLADVVLVGAGTARTEGYRGPHPKPEHAERRAAHGQRPAPVLALVSASLTLDPESDLFTGAERTIVITHGGSSRAARDRLAEVADVVVAGDDRVDLAAAVAALDRRQLARILCEGGPSLLGGLLAAGLLDELCLTVSAKAVGGAGPRITSGAPVEQTFRLAHLIEDDGTLLTRYVRA